jgi:hypothetical protein
MPFEEPQLTVRRSQRRAIGLDADLAVDPGHAEQVRFAPIVSLRDGSLPVTAVDLSEGGAGVIATTFLPSGCRGTLRLRDPRGGDDPLFEAPVAVTRVAMIDRRPGYQIGLAFTDAGRVFQERLDAFLELLDEAL